jgi:RNA polymerase sigma-70 factor, ECF subfamily
MSQELLNNEAADNNINKTVSSMINDTDLISRLHNGDPKAGAQLFNTYFHRLYSLVYYSVGKDHSVAEDITQETFLSALKAADRFAGKSNLYTWLVGIANHKIADHFRHLVNERKNINRVVLTTPDNNDTEKTPEIEFEKILASLPVHYRQVLLLKYVEEMPVVEISKVMKRTPKSIEGLLSRARNVLKNHHSVQGINDTKND